MSSWLPPFIWAAGLRILSSVPGEAYPAAPFPLADKAVHFIEYAALGALLARALARSSAWRSRAIAAVSVALAALYGAADEWHQTGVSGRMAEWDDLLADGVGACVGAAAAACWIARARRRHLDGGPAPNAAPGPDVQFAAQVRERRG